MGENGTEEEPKSRRDGEHLGSGGPATGAGLLENGRGLRPGERRCHLRYLQISGKSMEVALLPCLPAILSLVSPMVRSWLHVPSLLGLFGALLTLSPELLGYLSDTPVSDPEVQVPLAVAVEQYNQDRSDSVNYYKVLSLMKAQYKVGASVELHLKVDFVKTTCEKRAGRLTYRKIQECEELPGIQEILSCTFRVKSRSQKDEMFMMDSFCT